MLAEVSTLRRLASCIAKTILRSFTRVTALLVMANLHLAAIATEKVVYFHNHLAGTPIAATDSAGNLLWKQSYKPYGERLDPKAPATDTPWFSDKAYVEGAGLSYFGARWYDPQLGRFMGIDPKGFDEGSVLSFNRYAYANDNPYRYIDPDGRQAFIVTTLNQGAVIGGGKAATDLGHSVLGKPSEAQQIRQLEGFGSGQSLPSVFLPSVQMVDPLTLVLLGGAQIVRDKWSNLIFSESRGPVAGGGAKLENRTHGEATRIQNAADRTGIEISVVGSRAGGTAGANSDWDYVLSGGTRSARHSVKGFLARKYKRYWRTAESRLSKWAGRYFKTLYYIYPEIEMNDSVELLSSPGNYAVVQLPGRKFPGVVFQGDSLNSLNARLKEIRNDLSVNDVIAAIRELDELLADLLQVTQSYESMCRSRGIELPY